MGGRDPLAHDATGDGDELEVHVGDALGLNATRHFLDVLAGREAQEALTAREGRRVIALYDLFQRSNAERRAIAG